MFIYVWVGWGGRYGVGIGLWLFWERFVFFLDVFMFGEI